MAHRLPLALASLASGLAAAVHVLVWHRAFAPLEGARFDPEVVAAFALAVGASLGLALARGPGRARAWVRIDGASVLWLLATAAGVALFPGAASGNLALAAGLATTGALVGARLGGSGGAGWFWLGAAMGCVGFGSVILPATGGGLRLIAPATGAGLGLIASALLLAATTLVMRASVARSEGADDEPSNDSSTRPLLGRGFLPVAGVVSGFAAVTHLLSIRAPLGLLEAGAEAVRVSAVTCASLGIALGIALAHGIAGRASDASRIRHVVVAQLGLGIWLAAVVTALPELASWQARAQGVGAWLPAVLLAGVPAALASVGLVSLARLGARAGSLGLWPCLGAALAAALGTSSSLEIGPTLFAVVLLAFALAVWVLLGAQAEVGSAPAPAASPVASRPGRIEWFGALLLPLLVSLSYGGVSIERTLAAGAQARSEGRALPVELAHVVECGAVHSVSEHGDTRVLRIAGQPITSVSLAPPFVPAPDFWLAIAPFLTSQLPERALLLDLDGGVPLSALLEASLPRVDVALGAARSQELVAPLQQGQPDPLENARVSLLRTSGSQALRDAAAQGGHDLLTSAPRDPRRRRDAARLEPAFLQEARAGLRDGGVFASLLPLAQLDLEAAQAVLARFEQVFPGSILLDASLAGDGRAWILLGGTSPLRLDLDEIAARMREPLLARALRRYGVEGVEDWLTRIEGPTAAFLSAEAPEAPWLGDLDTRPTPPVATRPGDLLAGRSPAASLVPETTGRLEGPALIRTLAERGRVAHLAQWMSSPAASLSAMERSIAEARLGLLDPNHEAAALGRLEALATEYPGEAEPLRVAALHLAMRRGAFAESAALFEEAYERSGASRDAYDAARAWDRVDEARAWTWIERIPEAERADHPRIAWFEAKAALREGRRGAELSPLLVSLSQFRRSVEGRRLPGVAEVLVALARAAGRPDIAAIHAEAHRAEQQRAAAPFVDRARVALADARLEDAMQALSELAAVWPGSPELLELRARLAAAVGDERAAAQALRVVRAQASGPDQAIARENALRRELGLALLPRLEADEILAAGNRRPE